MMSAPTPSELTRLHIDEAVRWLCARLLLADTEREQVRLQDEAARLVAALHKVGYHAAAREASQLIDQACL